MLIAGDAEVASLLAAADPAALPHPVLLGPRSWALDLKSPFFASLHLAPLLIWPSLPRCTYVISCLGGSYEMAFVSYLSKRAARRSLTYAQVGEGEWGQESGRGARWAGRR